jgi:Cohesin domain
MTVTPSTVAQPSMPSSAPAASAPQGMPLTAAPAPIAPNTASAKEATSTDPGAAGPGSAAASGARPAVSVEGPGDVHVGEEFQVVVYLSTQDAITRLRSQVRFDPTAVQLIGSNIGEIVPAAAGNPVVSARAGGAQLDIVTTPDNPVQGDGGLMVLRFKALAPRPATTIAAMLSVLGGSGAAVGNGTAAPLNIVIQP